MKTVFKFVCIFSVFVSFAQFDKKLTFNAFLGSAIPLGAKVDADSVPYVFSNFNNAAQLGGGLLYNASSKFSIGANITFLYCLNYKNPIPVESKAQNIINQESKNYASSYFTNIGIGPYVKYKFFRNAKFNPYLFSEINLNYYSGYVAPRLKYYKPVSDDQTPDEQSILDRYSVLRYNSNQIKPNLALGTHFGAGLDVKLNDSFSIMFQVGYQIGFTASDESLRRNLEYISSQLGLRFSLIKSKSIL